MSNSRRPSGTPDVVSPIRAGDVVYFCADSGALSAYDIKTGKSLYRKGQHHVTRGFVAEHFRGAKRDCVPCALRARCLLPPVADAAGRAGWRSRSPVR